MGEKDPWQTEGGGVTRHVLESLRIPHDDLDTQSDVAPKIAKAQTLAYSASRPVALLLTRDLMWEDA
jgi:sulfopyruvate decarboxylase subunit alpha